MAGWAIRQTAASDRELVDGLLIGSRWKHLHLDWLEPAALSGRAPFLLASDRGLPVGCLACPPDSPGSCWLRAFAVVSGIQPELVWQRLWSQAEAELRALQVERVAALPTEGWFEAILAAAGYQATNAVIFMEREAGPGPTERPHRSRPVVAGDSGALLELDAAAFDPLWRLAPDSLQAALEQAERASLIELEGAPAGYQITTRSPLGAHLARLAVHPQRRRQGLGRALVQDALEAARRSGLGRLSVNTQADNLPSQRLYRSLGFRETGQRYRVFESRLVRL